MATEVRMPQLGLTMEEGTVTKWFKQVGDEVKVGDVLAEITTDKLTNEVTSEVDGTVLKLCAEEGQDVLVKGLLCVIGNKGEAVSGGESKVDAVSAATTVIQSGVESMVKAPAAQAAAPAVQKAAGGRVKISPLARKTAEKLGVDYTLLIGTGPGGRIVQKDVLNAKEAAKAVPAAVTAAEAPEKPKAAKAASVPLMDGDTVEKLTGMRKVVADRMFASHSQIPTVTINTKADVTKLMKFRKDLNEGREVKFSVNDFILKAAAKALKNYRKVLVSLDGDQIIHRAHVNLGMAVALEEGLIVPVIKDADKLGLGELAAKAKDLAQRARDGKLGMDEYSGSTFTVSNLGMYGVESFTPIINQPDAAILGVSAAQEELGLDDEGKVYRKQVMRLSLTFDHRLMDGAVAANFEKALRELLENPMEIIL
jgi:pyruvate dehydrogenase E2 component (dihydrolipoamide acetyltransferase)